MLPAPTAPSEGSAGVRNLVGRTRRPTDPFSILAHQLRHRFPSTSKKPGGLPRHRCSAPLLGMTNLSVPLCSSWSEDHFEPRRARWRSSLPAPLTSWPRFRSRGNFSIAFRRRSEPWDLPHPLAVSGLGGGLNRRPDHKCTMRLSAESGKRNIW